MVKKLVKIYLDKAKRKRVKTRDIEDYLLKKLSQKDDIYQEFVVAIKELVAEDEIRAVLARGQNARRPRLYNWYQIKEVEQKVDEELKKELLTTYHPQLSVAYYLEHPQHYKADKKYLQKLDCFLKNNQELKEITANERSFQIFNDEKFLSSNDGSELLQRTKLKLSDLNCYLTYEPFFYYRCANDLATKNILIIENKDTFYSLKQLMQEGSLSWAGNLFSLLIYGEGNKIQKSFSFFSELSAYQIAKDRLMFYYFGDLDPEGIAIWWRLQQRYQVEFKPMQLFYQRLVELYQEDAPVLKKAQNYNKQAVNAFTAYFSKTMAEAITEILKSKHYIPQEGLNYQILKELSGG